MGDGGQLDLFTITAIDPPWRDNRDAMGYPFLSLQNGRTAPILYEDENVWLKVSASAEHGIASIWDWDIIIFASSHLNEAIESGRRVSPRIEFAPYNCLKQIGRPIGGRPYQLLADAIRRLEATLVVTDIRLADQPNRGYERPFRWLKDYGFPKKYSRHYTTPDGITHITPRDSTGEADPAQPWMIELHPWLYNAIVRQGDILAVHPDYFQLRGGIERWLYRLARKAVRDKAEPPAIRFKMETLHARSGVTNDLRYFAHRIRKLAEAQPLPEYGVAIEYRKGQRELVTLYRDPAKPCRPPRGRRLKTIEGEPIKPVVTTDTYLDEEPPLVIVPETIIEPIETTEQPVTSESIETELAEFVPITPETLREIRRAVAAKPRHTWEQGFAGLYAKLLEATERGARVEEVDVKFPNGITISLKIDPSLDHAELKAALTQSYEELRELLFD